MLSPSNHPQGLGGCSTPPDCDPPPRATTSGAVRGERASIGQISAHFLVSAVELILCNDDEKMKSGTTSPTQHALAPRQQCPRCGGARQRRLLCVTTTTPQSRRGGARGQRLLPVTLWHLSVGSRFSLKQPPGPHAVARRRLEVSSQDGAWSRKDVCRLLPRLAQAPLGAAADRRQPPLQGAGALCQHQGGAGDRSPFTTLRAHPNKHPSFRCDGAAAQPQPFENGLWAALRWQLAMAGPLPFKAKEFVLMQTKHETVLVQRRALQVPEVMLDDAV